MKRPSPIQSVLKWSLEMHLGLPVTLYCIVSNYILGQPRSHGPLLRGGRVGEELGFHGNEVTIIPAGLKCKNITEFCWN